MNENRDMESIIEKVDKEQESLADEVLSRLRVYLQPIFQADTLELIGAEALIREKEPQANNSARALEIIDKYNLHKELDLFVLKEVCNFIDSKDIPEERVAVNISKLTLEIKGVADEIITLISRSYKAREKITLEINEKTDFKSDVVLSNIRKLASCEIDLAIDDFGGNDIALFDILNESIAGVKLDRLVIKDLETNENKVRMIKAMKNMLDTVDITVTIEGVEDKEQLDLVRGLGYARLQGFILGVPIDIEEYIKLYH